MEPSPRKGALQGTATTFWIVSGLLTAEAARQEVAQVLKQGGARHLFGLSLAPRMPLEG